MTGMSPERQHAPGKVAGGNGAGDRDGSEFWRRGLLHDLGHQLMTVSLLASSLQADAGLSAAARHRSQIMARETARTLEMLTEAVSAGGCERRPATDLIDVRECASQIAQLTGLAHDATIRLLPGQPAFVRADPLLVWRVLCNIVDNAVRAAGPGGDVSIGISRGNGTIVEVTDDGGGFGCGQAGTAGLGLAVVRQLLASCGGRLEISARPGGGCRARATLGPGCDRIVLPRLRGAWAAIA